MDINTIDRTERRNIEKTGRGHAKPSNEHNAEKQAQIATEQEAKKDSVEISKEGRKLALISLNADFLRKIEESRAMRGLDDTIPNIMKSSENISVNRAMRELDDTAFVKKASEISDPENFAVIFDPENFFVKKASEIFISEALNGKIGEAGDETYREVAAQLSEMLAKSYDLDVDVGFRLATRAANREAAKDLAKYIAENYLSDPKEAQAFVDTINKFAEMGEWQDKGYRFLGGDYYEEKVAEWSALNEEDRASYLSSFKPIKFNPQLDWIKEHVQIMINTYKAYPELLERQDDSLKALWPKSEMPNDSSEEGVWEKVKEWLYNRFFTAEEAEQWNADLYKSEQNAQNIIDNAKLITDFSNNEKWNKIMNLLS